MDFYTWALASFGVYSIIMLFLYVKWDWYKEPNPWMFLGKTIAGGGIVWFVDLLVIVIGIPYFIIKKISEKYKEKHSDVLIDNLDDAIAHAEKKGRQCKGNCSLNHKQLALWLKELKIKRAILNGYSEELKKQNEKIDEVENGK